MAKQINVRMSLIDGVSSTLKKINQNINATSDQFKKNFNKELVLADKNANKLIKSFSGLAKTMAGVFSVATLGTLTKGLKSMAEVESALAKTASIAGLTKGTEEYQRMIEVSNKLAKTTSKTAKEVANAMEYMALAGWDFNSVLSEVDKVVKLSEATGLDLAQTSDLLTDSMGALGLSANQAASYIDTVAKASTKSNATAGQFFESIIGSGAALKSTNTQLEEMIALQGTLANVGKKGSESGTILASLSNRLYKPTGESAKGMEMLKLSPIDGKGNVKSMATLFKEIESALGKVDEKTKSIASAYIFGQYKSEGLAIVNAMKSVNGELSAYDKLTKDIKDNSGSLDIMHGTQTDTLMYDFAKLKSAYDDFARSFASAFGEELRPLMQRLTYTLTELSEKAGEISKKIVDTGKSIFKFFKDNEKGIKTLATGVTVYLTSYVGVVKTLKGFKKLKEIKSDFLALAEVLPKVNLSKVKLSNPFKEVKGGISSFKFSLKSLVSPLNLIFNPIKSVTKAVKLLGLVFRANPLGFIITAISALVLGFVKLYKSSETVRGYCSNLLDKIKELGQVIADIYTSKIKPAFDSFKAQGSELWVKLKPSLEKVALVIGSVAGFIIDVFGNVISFFVDFGTSFVTIFSGVATFLTGVFTLDFKKAFDGLKSIVVGFKDFFVNLWKNIKDIFKDVKNMFSFGKEKAVVKVSKEVTENVTGTYSKKPVENVTGTYSKKPIENVTGTYSDGSIPRYALGTSYFKGGVAQINEHGGELVTLPSGSKITPADKTNKILEGKSTNITLNLTVQGNVIGEDKYAYRMAEIFANKVSTALANS